jgi:hypothetical protein
MGGAEGVCAEVLGRRVALEVPVRDHEAIMAQARGMLTVALPATTETPIVHDGWFLLIDRQGRTGGTSPCDDLRKLADLDRDARQFGAEDE